MFDTPLPPAYDTTNAISFQLEVEDPKSDLKMRQNFFSQYKRECS